MTPAPGLGPSGLRGCFAAWPHYTGPTPWLEQTSPFVWQATQLRFRIGLMHPNLLWDTIIMSAAPAAVSDMLVTVKSREVQRAMLAEMRGDRREAANHFLAAAHLELVLADDYAQAGQPDLALRSGISAASCFWSAGHPERARPMFDELLQSHPGQAEAIRQAVDELERDYPPGP
jgi:hypothetical protein